MEAPLVTSGDVEYPNLDLAQKIYEYENESSQELKETILKVVTENSMAIMYRNLCDKV